MEFLPDGSISSPQEYIKYYSEITESFQILTMKGGSDAFNELKEKQEKETKLFDEMYLPCALQGILLYEQEKDWYHSPDMKLANKNKLLYRVTKSEFLNTELELETSDGESQVGKIVKLKKFMSFAIGENDKQFLTEEEYPNPQLFGTYDTGLVVTISEKTKAKSISFTNKNKNGQREALFPIGTSLEVTKFKKNTGPDDGTPQNIFELTEVQNESKKKAEKPKKRKWSLNQRKRKRTTSHNNQPTKHLNENLFINK